MPTDTLLDEPEAATEEVVAVLLAEDEELSTLLELLPDIAELLRLDAPVEEDTSELELATLETDGLELLAEAEVAVLELKEDPVTELEAELRLLAAVEELLDCKLVLLPLERPLDPVLLDCEGVPALAEDDEVSPPLELLLDVATGLELEALVEDATELELEATDDDGLELLAEADVTTLELAEDPVLELDVEDCNELEAEPTLLEVTDELPICELVLLLLGRPDDPELPGCEEVPLLLDVVETLFDALLAVELPDCELWPLLLDD